MFTYKHYHSPISLIFSLPFCFYQTTLNKSVMFAFYLLICNIPMYMIVIVLYSFTWRLSGAEEHLIKIASEHMHPSTHHMLLKLLYRTHLLHSVHTHALTALSNSRGISLLDLLTASDVLNPLLE